MHVCASFKWGVAIACLLVLGACSRNGSNEAPPRTSEPLSIESQPSTITIPVILSISHLQTQLEGKVPTTLHEVDEHLDACIPAKWATVCPIPKMAIKCGSKWKFAKCRNVADGCAVKELKTKISPDIACDLKGYVTRGKIAMHGADNVIALRMPVHVDVSAKNIGGVIKSETATGTADVQASATLDIGEDWQPAVTFTADYSWEDRIGVDILGQRVTFASKVDPKIRAELAKFKDQIPEQLERINLKEKLASAWASGFASIQLSDEPSAWLRFSPQAIGYSGYTISDDAIQFTLMAGGLTETFLGVKPPDAVPTPFPDLERGVESEGFHFYLPVLASYASLRDEARRALQAGSEQNFDVPRFGEVKVTFEDVRIYQTTNGALAIGVTMNVDKAGKFLDTKGTIWLSAKPVVDNDKHVASVDELQIVADTDNSAVNLLVSILSIPTVNDRLKNAMRYDFNEKYVEALENANRALTREVAPDLFFNGQIDSVAVDRIAATPEGVYVGLMVSGNATLRYTEPLALAQ